MSSATRESREARGDARALTGERYRPLLNASPDGIAITDLGGRVLMASPVAVRMLRAPDAEALIGRPILDFIVPEDRERAAARLALMFTEPRSGPSDYQGLRLDGTTFAIDTNAEFIRDENGAPTQILLVVRDISERKQAEAALRLSEERYRSILNASPDGIAITDLRGNILMGSPAAHAIFGFSESEDLVGRHISSFLAPEDRARAAENLATLAYREPGQPREYRGIRTDGATVDVEINGQFVPDAEGRPQQIVFIVRDIASRKQTEALLRRKDEAHSAILNTAMDGYWLVDTQGRILEANKAYCRMSGYSLEELQGLRISDIEGVMDLAEIDRRMALIIRDGGARFESTHRRKDGTTWDVEASVHFQPDGGGRLPSFFRDITERKKAEAATAASLQQKVALLKEIHHRVKNNLQIITSLLRLETSRSDVPGTRQTLKEMQGRVLAMALLHETLYRTGDFGQVDLGPYIEKLSRQFMRAQGATAGGATLDLALGTVAVSLDQAIPCGLIVNELLTNAVKHAFVDRTPGTVRVALTEDGVGDIRLQVSDNGQGLPADFDARRARSLGLQLVTDLARQLRGRLDIDHGATFTVTFRRPEAGAP